MPSMAQEYKEVSETRFWKSYVEEIMRIRDLSAQKLRTGRIEEPVVQGKIWQEIHRYMEALLVHPRKMIEADEADNREARRGTKE